MKEQFSLASDNVSMYKTIKSPETLPKDRLEPNVPDKGWQTMNFPKVKAMLKDQVKARKEIGNNLMKLEIEKKRLEDEYSKLMDKGPKNIAQRKLRGELEVEIETLAKEITNIKRNQA